MDTDPELSWHPIARSDDAVLRHVCHGQLLGRELVVWRADDGYVNVWENRCMHRGVRLSIGTNEGRELRCQYHGWRYANQTAGCTYIPAHPADAPARTICNRVFPTVERYGLIWSGEEPQGEPPSVIRLDQGQPFGLRNLPVDAAPEVVLSFLETYRFQPTGRLDHDDAEVIVDTIGNHRIELTASDGDARSSVVFFVQPVDSGRSVIRGVLTDAPAGEDRIAVLRHHSQRLERLRTMIENHALTLPTPEPIEPTFKRGSVESAVLAEPNSGGREAPLRVKVARKWEVADAITGFEFESIAGQLPTFQPGAHIDVHLPNGLVRQYSLTNGPGELGHYVIGVKLEPESRGGSRCLHESVREGDVLAISEPRNNFPLRRDAIRTVFVAGGVGITPLLSMAQTLHHSRLDHELHYFAQSQLHLAFPDVLATLSDSLRPHLGLSPEETGQELEQILSAYAPATHLYVCGPGPMLDATRRIASDAGWPEESIHFEYFKNTTPIDDSTSFTISLARSALTVPVPAGQTILEVLRANGITMPSSCEQGACGTCMVPVLDGEPDHHDVYLSASERAGGDRIMTCVSRARSERLVLDI